MLINMLFLTNHQQLKKATGSTNLLMDIVGGSVDQRDLLEARNISLIHGYPSDIKASVSFTKQFFPGIGMPASVVDMASGGDPGKLCQRRFRKA